jgi:ribonuclease HI
VKYMVHLEFKATNNMAEYEALIFSLSAVLSLGIHQLLVKGDSQLIIKQVRGECRCNEPKARSLPPPRKEAGKGLHCPRTATCSSG